MNLAIAAIRKVAVALLRATERDITVKNPWTGDRLLLNSFRHKGYWFRGKQRERATMEMLGKLLRPGDLVIEAGAHIGFVTQWMAKIVGPSGRVVAFEPGSQNGRDVAANVAGHPTIVLETAPFSDSVAEATFFEENVTGQNNSLNPTYEAPERNAKALGIRLEVTQRTVMTTTVDEYVRSRLAACPQFLKIDTEGFEAQVLAGAQQTLRGVRSLMLEVTEGKQDEIGRILRQHGFSLLTEEGQPVPQLSGDFLGNVFAVRDRPISAAVQR